MKYSYIFLIFYIIFLQIIWFLEIFIFFENFNNISENNIISVELARVQNFYGLCLQRKRLGVGVNILCQSFA
jgi:hypothetical protein